MIPEALGPCRLHRFGSQASQHRPGPLETEATVSGHQACILKDIAANGRRFGTSRVPSGFHVSLALAGPPLGKFLDPWTRRVSVCLSLFP